MRIKKTNIKFDELLQISQTQIYHLQYTKINYIQTCSTAQYFTPATRPLTQKNDYSKNICDYQDSFSTFLLNVILSGTVAWNNFTAFIGPFIAFVVSVVDCSNMSQANSKIFSCRSLMFVIFQKKESSHTILWDKEDSLE